MPVVKIKTLIPNGRGVTGNQHTEPYRVGGLASAGPDREPMDLLDLRRVIRAPGYSLREVWKSSPDIGGDGGRPPGDN